MNDASNQSSMSLLGQLSESVPALFRKELDLLRAEIDEKLGTAGNGLGMIVAGGLIAMTALNVLASALVAAVAASGLEAGWSALLVGAAFAILALLLVKQGSDRLKASRLSPERTARSFGRDAEMVKETVR